MNIYISYFTLFISFLIFEGNCAEHNKNNLLNDTITCFTIGNFSSPEIIKREPKKNEKKERKKQTDSNKGAEIMSSDSLQRPTISEYQVILTFALLYV